LFSRGFVTVLLCVAFTGLLGSLIHCRSVAAGLWQGYKTLYERRVEEAREYDIWGNTWLPPAGMWALQYKFNTVRANTRYDADGNEGSILEPIDILGGTLDFNPKGSAKAHKFAFLCGLGKRLAFGMECQVGTLDLEFDVNYVPPDIDAMAFPGAQAILEGILRRNFNIEPFTQSLEGLWQTIELLGHPRPVLEQEDDGLKVGDLSVAFGWNYFRAKNLSFMAAFKVSFPTGHIADSNEALVYALGPDLDVGVGSYGFEFGHLLDFRLPKPLDWIVVMTEVFYSFYTEHSRESPTVFTEPDQDLLDLINAIGALTGGVDLGPFFPDLSRMEAEYDYLPGSKVRGVLQIAPNLFGILPLSLGIQGTYTNASEITTSTPEFVQYIDAIGLLADSWLIDSWVKLTLGLFPFYVPVTLAVGFNMPIAGKNSLILKDNWEFSFQFYSPWFFGEQIPPRFKKR
jgi:hypothetical protein